MEAITSAINRNLKQRIMRRVYMIWFWKSVAPMLAVEALLLVGVAAGVLTQISVKAILVNALAASSDVWAFVKFFISNFLVKSMQSRLLVAVYLVLAGFFLRDVASALRRLKGYGSEILLSAALSRNRSTNL